MNRRITEAVLTASRLAVGGSPRQYQLAAIGWRGDGVIVYSRNGPSMEPNIGSHAEARLAKKLTPGSIVLVVRMQRQGRLGMAKPCRACQAILKSVGVSKVYYSTAEGDIKHISLANA